jgi:hypothetical protein
MPLYHRTALAGVLVGSALAGACLPPLFLTSSVHHPASIQLKLATMDWVCTVKPHWQHQAWGMSSSEC